MKKLWDSPFLFWPMAFPMRIWDFWGHGETGKVLANFLSIIGVITLMKWTYHRSSLKALFLGNALSLLVSCVCLSVFGTEKWGGTFEPAAAFQMLCAAALLALAVQLVWWRVKQRTQKAVLRSNRSKCRTFQIKGVNHEVRFYSH